MKLKTNFIVQFKGQLTGQVDFTFE